MASVNEVRLIGNLGQEPDVRFTQAGTAVCTLNVATNRRWKDDAGKDHEEVSWHRVVVWGKQAENAGKYLAKGDPVYVAGRLHTRDYEAEGTKRWVTEVIAQSVQFLKPAPKNRPPHPAGEGRAAGGPPPDEWSDDAGPPPTGDDDIPF